MCRPVCGPLPGVDPPGRHRGRLLGGHQAGPLVLAHHHRSQHRLPVAHPHQVGTHLAGGLVAVRRVLRQRLEHDRVQRGRDRRVQLRRGARVLPDVLVGDRDRGVPGERRVAGEQLEQHAACGVDVRPGVHRLAACLLRGEVLRGPDDGRGLGDVLALAQRAGDAEVHHLDRAGGVDHDVGRLDVAVDDAVLVREVERGADVGHHLDDALLGQRTGRLDDLAERLPVDELHDDVRERAELALDLAGVVDRDDGRVVQRRRVLRLAAEPELELRVTCEVGAEDLHGHVPGEPGVHAVVHLGHAAIAERVAQLVPLGQQSGCRHQLRFPGLEAYSSCRSRRGPSGWARSSAPEGPLRGFIGPTPLVVRGLSPRMAARRPPDPRGRPPTRTRYRSYRSPRSSSDH